MEGSQSEGAPVERGRRGGRGGSHGKARRGSSRGGITTTVPSSSSSSSSTAASASTTVPTSSATNVNATAMVASQSLPAGQSRKHSQSKSHAKSHQSRQQQQQKQQQQQQQQQQRRLVRPAELQDFAFFTSSGAMYSIAKPQSRLKVVIYPLPSAMCEASFRSAFPSVVQCANWVRYVQGSKCDRSLFRDGESDYAFPSRCYCAFSDVDSVIKCHAELDGKSVFEGSSQTVAFVEYAPLQMTPSLYKTAVREEKATAKRGSGRKDKEGKEKKGAEREKEKQNNNAMKREDDLRLDADYLEFVRMIEEQRAAPPSADFLTSESSDAKTGGGPKREVTMTPLVQAILAKKIRKPTKNKQSKKKPSSQQGQQMRQTAEQVQGSEGRPQGNRGNRKRGRGPRKQPSDQPL
eukprot:ANDGO_03759.mRNA.1 hypothetical protein